MSRNELCLCGSERKYKRCCMDRVESSVRELKQAVGWDQWDGPQRDGIVDFLGLAVGLQSDPDGEAVPLPKADGIAALQKLMQAVDDGNEHLVHSWHHELTAAFSEDLELRFSRLDPERLEEVTGGDLPRSGHEGSSWVIEQLVNDEHRDDFALDLLMACRGPMGPQEVQSLVWGAWCLADPGPLGNNLFFQMLYDITTHELTQGERELESLSGEFLPGMESLQIEPDLLGEWADRYEALLWKYPSLQKLMDSRYYRQVSPAMEAFYQGRLSISLPAWTVVGGLLLMLQEGWAMFREGHIDLDDMPFDWLSMAWELDGPAFSPQAREYLQNQLSDPSFDPELGSALSTIAETLGPVFVFSQLLAFCAVYASALENAWNPDGTLVTGLPGDEPTLFLADLADPECLEDYANALDEAERHDAAAHVRWCVGTLGGDGAALEDLEE